MKQPRPSWVRPAMALFAIAWAIGNAQAACHYYKDKDCPQTYACYGQQWSLVDTDTWQQRWDCGSGFLDPLYLQHQNCKYYRDGAPIDAEKYCGPVEMVPRTSNDLPITCPAKPCVGPGSPVNPPGSGSGT